MTKPIDYLPEQLKTSKNLCDISLLLIETGNRHLLATVLELLFEQVTQITEENCVVNPLSGTQTRISGTENRE